MSARAWRAAALALALAGPSCSRLPPVVSLEPPRVGERGRGEPDAEAERAYQRALERYSAHAEVYADLDTRAFVAGTFQSWPFREARVKRISDFKHLTPAEVDARRAEEKAQLDGAYELFVGLHLNDSRFDDLDKKDSVWRVALVTSAGETMPCEIRRIGRSTLALRTLYPYLDEFWTAYEVKFPRVSAAGAQILPPGERAFTLRLSSTLGTADLRFVAE